jgi:Methyltransferase domain
MSPPLQERGWLTDKAILGYLPTYRRLAGEIGPAGRVCEVGVMQGWSLELWQALFPDGVVVGVDHNPEARWPPGTVRVVADQADEGLPARLQHISGAFDLIVDDASHLGKLTRRTWELLWPLVAPGGWYVVEDWQVGFDVPEWHMFDSSMVDLAEWFLHLLDHQGGEVDEIAYRFGMILLRKRPADAR